MNPAPPVTRRRTRGRLAANLREACAQAVPPVREARGIRTFAPENRVRRAGSGTGELLRRDPAYAAVEPGFLEDRLGEVGPRALAVGGDVPETERAAAVDEVA